MRRSLSFSPHAKQKPLLKQVGNNSWRQGHIDLLPVVTLSLQTYLIKGHKGGRVGDEGVSVIGQGAPQEPEIASLRMQCRNRSPHSSCLGRVQLQRVWGLGTGGYAQESHAVQGHALHGDMGATCADLLLGQ